MLALSEVRPPLSASTIGDRSVRSRRSKVSMRHSTLAAATLRQLRPEGQRPTLRGSATLLQGGLRGVERRLHARAPRRRSCHESRRTASPPCAPSPRAGSSLQRASAGHQRRRRSASIASTSRRKARITPPQSTPFSEWIALRIDSGVHLYEPELSLGVRGCTASRIAE